ncbi:hypothetical protein G6F31_019410 [Rhizopus arrhizus]|nr:hypothetical protein G6F31_019410 [Rhizopus arrhizus]
MARALLHQVQQQVDLLAVAGFGADVGEMLGRLARISLVDGVPAGQIAVLRGRYVLAAAQLAAQAQQGHDARMSSRRSALPARSGPRRISEKSDVPPPMSITSTSSSRSICDS